MDVTNYTHVKPETDWSSIGAPIQCPIHYPMQTNSQTSIINITGHRSQSIASCQSKCLNPALYNHKHNYKNITTERQQRYNTQFVAASKLYLNLLSLTRIFIAVFNSDHYCRFITTTITLISSSYSWHSNNNHNESNKTYPKAPTSEDKAAERGQLKQSQAPVVMEI